MKRWMAAGLSAVLLAGLSGCGSAQNEQNASKETSARIGFITAYTGPGSAYGQAMKDGVDLAVREINSNPGTRVKIDLVTYDTKLNKTEAISAMKKAIEQDKVLAVEGPMTSGEMMAAGPCGPAAEDRGVWNRPHGAGHYRHRRLYFPKCRSRRAVHPHCHPKGGIRSAL